MTAPMTTAPDKDPDEESNGESGRATSLAKPPGGDRLTAAHRASAA